VKISSWFSLAPMRFPVKDSLKTVTPNPTSCDPSLLSYKRYRWPFIRYILQVPFDTYLDNFPGGAARQMTKLPLLSIRVVYVTRSSSCTVATAVRKPPADDPPSGTTRANFGSHPPPWPLYPERVTRVTFDISK